MGWLLPLVLVGNILVFLRPEGWGPGLFFFLEALSALFAIIYKYARASNAIQRQQTKWVVYGSSLAWLSVLGLIVLTGILYPAGQPAGLPTLVLNTAWSLGMLFIPLSFGIAILRSHLRDIDILIRRTLVYTSLTAMLALVYFACVIVLQGLLTLIAGQSSTAVEVVSTLAIAGAFFPLRRIQSFIERRFYRNQYDAAKALATFAATARDETDLDRLAERLVSVVEETMQPETAGLWLRSPTDSRQPPASGRS